MLCKTISLDANKNIIRSRIPVPVKLLTPSNPNDASWLDPTKTKKCYICGQVIDVSSTGCVIAQSVTDLGNRVYHCESCFRLLGTKIFKKWFIKASAELHEFDIQLQQTNEKLLQTIGKTNESASDLEKQICEIQILLEKCNQEIIKFNSEQVTVDVEQSVNVRENPEQKSKNVQDRIKRKTRAVIFNVPYYDDDKGLKLVGDFTDFELILDLLSHSNIRFKPKGCFRVLSRNNNNNPRPPLIVEFHTEYQKYEFLIKCREIITAFNESKVYLQGSWGVNGARIRTDHWIGSLSIAPDRTYADRQMYKVLKEQMIAQNNELVTNGNTEEKWIISNLSLRLIRKTEGGINSE